MYSARKAHGRESRRPAQQSVKRSSLVRRRNKVISTAAISDAKEREELDRKLLHLSPFEERVNDQKTFRQLQAKARFVPLPQNASQASPEPQATELVSPAEVLRLEKSSRLDEDDETDAEDTDIRPLASMQVMKKQTKQTWKLDDKKRTKALQHHRKAAAF